MGWRGAFGVVGLVGWSVGRVVEVVGGWFGGRRQSRTGGEPLGWSS